MDGASPRVSPLRRLLRHATAHRGRVRTGVLLSIGNKVFDLAPPLLIGTAVDVVVQREESLLARLGVVDPWEQLTVLAALTVAIWLIESLLEYLQKIVWRNLAQTMQQDLRAEAYASVQRQEMAFFAAGDSGRLSNVLVEDVNQLERFLDGGADSLIQMATSVTIIGLIYAGISVEVAAFAFLPMPFIVWGSIAYQKRLEPRYAEVREAASDLQADLNGNLGGMATIQAHASEEHEATRIEARSRAYSAANRRAIALSSAFSPLIRILILIGFTATLLIGGRMALDGRLEAGEFTVLVYMTQRLLWPLTVLGQTLDLYQRAMASTRRILDLIDRRPKIEDGDRALARDAVEGDITFEGVHFAYPGRDPLFEGFDLRCEAKRTTAIVGATGSGKSTLTRLLLRFYDVDRGRVVLDGQDVRTLRLADLRTAVGIVAQDVFLFHGTVRENVAYGRPSATDEEVREAARVAEALDWIEELPDGWETVVGERGQRLSGGQRQRLALARAVLEDPPILVLDEATSAVDNETEAAIQRSLDVIAQGRTTLVIAHRLSTVRNADTIVVLSEGRIVEQGRHEDLVGAGGEYARLWGVQTGERDAEGLNR